MSTESVALDGDLDTEALEVDNHEEDDDGSNDAHHVRETLAPESLTEGTALVVVGEQEVEKRDDSALELGSTAGVYGGGRERLPNDGLADVCGNEQRDAGAEAVSLLEELIQKNDDESRNDQLNDEQQADTCTKVGGLTVKAGQHVNGRLTERDDQREH